MLFNHQVLNSHQTCIIILLLWGNWDSERLNHLPKITEWINGRARIRKQATLKAKVLNIISNCLPPKRTRSLTTSSKKTPYDDTSTNLWLQFLKCSERLTETFQSIQKISCILTENSLENNSLRLRIWWKEVSRNKVYISSDEPRSPDLTVFEAAHSNSSTAWISAGYH